ncbi:MAG: ImmA/IrrE family metallo-endopeptidase [Selenomonadaceae bacterium]|nr:ImmA/IrrE family metallo-endopeptidase [Selenomonadaceae bacterium]
MPLNIPLRVRNLVRRYATTDPYRIAKDMRCEVMLAPLPNHINGKWRRILRRKYIFINDRLDEFWARFVCAHELGHIILHPHVNTAFLLRSTLFSVDKIEKQANRFAIELLTVGSSCRCQQYDSMTVRECAARYGIPREFEELLAFYQ